MPSGATTVFALAAALCFGSVGCSGGSSAPPQPTPDPTPTPTPAPAPTVTDISPNGAPAGALAFTLIVTGSNFLPTSTVQWNGSSRTTTLVSGTQLQAHIMSADLAAPGKVTVTVVNPAAGGGNSNGFTFTIAPDTLAFLSTRAFDGTDANNANQIANVWVMNPNGSNPIPLTKLSASNPQRFNTSMGDEVWSPDGSKIAFDSTRGLDGGDDPSLNNQFNVWVMNADGSNLTALTKGTQVQSFVPAWSPDGSKIAFVSDRVLNGSDDPAANFTDNIWVMNADGSNAVPVTNLVILQDQLFGIGCIQPVWSPNGSKIAFVSNRALDGSNAANVNSIFNIWVMNADGSSPVPLTKITVTNVASIQPVWSPDGSKIAFMSSRALDGSNTANTNSTDNVWVINADGSNAVPLTKLTVAGNNPPIAWSPDGSKIAFLSSRALDGSNAPNTNATLNIWVISADGSNLVPLTKLTAAFGISNLGTFIWSPDGSKIIFSSSRALDGSDSADPNGNSNIWMMNADGSNLTAITQLNVASSNSPQQP
jgi:Tol biopolymer transport system component